MALRPAALKRVDLSTDVYFVCLNHAMCTEGEEIVGLLVGEVNEKIAHVVAVLILRRSDKRKDRVEISPEQLSNASTEAEKLACIMKRPVRVVGWYHSHPKLTVYPSLVDVCTQESYQLMDEGFIGMIFSVFNSDPNKFGGRIQMICYQSQTLVDCNMDKSHVEIPIKLVPSSYISDVCMNSVVQLPRFLCQEEQLAYQMANQVPLDYLTRLHNSSVYLRKMGQIAEVICGPLLKMLEERILNNEIKRKRLQERKKALTALVEKAKSEKAKKAYEKLQKLQKQLEHALKEQARQKENLESVEKDSKVGEINESKDLKNENEELKVASPSKTEENCRKPRTPEEESPLREVPHGIEDVVSVEIDQEEVEFQDWQAVLNEQEWQSSMQRITNDEIAQLGNFKAVSVTNEVLPSCSKVPLAEIPKESLKTKPQHLTDEKQSKKQKVQELLDELAVIQSGNDKCDLPNIQDKKVGLENQPEKPIEQNVQHPKASSPNQASEVPLSSQISDCSKNLSKNIPDSASRSKATDALVCSPAYVVKTDSAKNIASQQNADLNLSLSSTDSKIYIEPISPPDVHSSESMSPS